MEPSSNSKIAKDATASVAKPKRRLKITDIMAAVIFLVICFFLVKTISAQISLKHEVSAAKVVTGQVVSDINSTNGTAVRALGDGSFQQSHSADELTGLFKTIKTYAHGTAVVDTQTVTNNGAGQAVSILYKYPDKPQFYISIKVDKVKGSDKWQLVSISGNPDRSKLIAK